MGSQRISPANARHPEAFAEQAEIACKVVGDPKELDRDLARSVSPCIASYTRLPQETGVPAARAKRSQLHGWAEPQPMVTETVTSLRPGFAVADLLTGAQGA
jgi:hypothetical protein